MADFILSSLRGGMNNTDPDISLPEDQSVLRVCSRCRVEQPENEFYFNAKKERFNSWCKSCLAVDMQIRRTRQSKESKQASYRKQNLRVKFDLSPEQYDEMFLDQGGLCKICRQPETAVDHHNRKIKRLAVDHDPVTGKVRKLLCSSCNTGIGLLKHRADLLQAAIDYLVEHQ